MANSLASLKSLPCPAGNKCNAFQCLFKHDGDEDGTLAPTINTEQPVADNHQDPPRKRIKLSSEITPSSHQHRSDQIGSDQAMATKQESTSLPKQPAADKKPISPPPLNRKTPSSVKQSEQKENQSSKNEGATSSSTSPLANKVSETPKLTPKAPPKKPESLNPRLLTRSPAQHDIRLKLVKALHEQYARLNTELKKVATDDDQKLVLTDQELIVKTLDDEQEAAIKKPSIYGNSIKNRIMSYKRMPLLKWKEERSKAIEALNPQTSKGTSSVPEPIVTGLTASQEVEFLRRLVWPLDGLERYGYVASVPTADDIKAAREAVEASGNTEVCDRCTRRFQVFPGRREEDGALASNGSCTHHPGKMYYMERAPGDRARPQRKYRCCNRNIEDESSGCTTSPTHVFKTTDPKRLASVLNFAETPPNPDVPAGRAVGFDCEMGYTVHGLELIRITAVSWPEGEELLDILVQPVGEYMDLNTRYSGVTPEDMVTAVRWKPGDDHRPTIISSTDATKPPKRKLKLAPSPKAARDLLFSLINPDTPLIGHGLENDLNAARIIHQTCVDTVLLYPHKRGLPIRNGLKYLMETLLGRKIQVEAVEGTPEGHDSAEDARAAGELVRLKVRDEWKDMCMKGWTIEEGEIKPPSEEWTVVGGAKTKKPGGW